jgi:hypothetical protein
MDVRKLSVGAALVVGLGAAPSAGQAAPPVAGTVAGLRAAAATHPGFDRAAARRCWSRNGIKHCRRGNESSPYPNDYFYFAPNTMPTARRGWNVNSPVQHSPPSPR